MEGPDAQHQPGDPLRGRSTNPPKPKGGEATIVDPPGRLQLRLAPPGRITKAAEQAFLRALSASANVRLSAAAAGFAHSNFYARRRSANRSPVKCGARSRSAVSALEGARLEARLESDEEDVAAATIRRRSRR